MRQSYLDMKENIDINIQLVSPSNAQNSKLFKAKNVLLKLSQQDSPSCQSQLQQINIHTHSPFQKYNDRQHIQQTLEVCTQHGLQIGNRFCLQCYCYNICQKCLATAHKSHMILSFQNQTETKQLTKQFLIEKIEETLVKMKSRQNEVKSHSGQIQLVKKTIKTLQEDILSVVRQTFNQIESSISSYYYCEQKKYFQSVDNFYESYNCINDQLRQTLLQIVDAQIDICSFQKERIIKQPPAIPGFDKFKMVLQKSKKYYRGIIDQVKQLQSCVSVKSNKNSSRNIQSKTLKKYDKFLTKMATNQATQGKSSLLKTLNIIENMK